MVAEVAVPAAVSSAEPGARGAWRVRELAGLLAAEVGDVAEA